MPQRLGRLVLCLSLFSLDLSEELCVDSEGELLAFGVRELGYEPLSVNGFLDRLVFSVECVDDSLAADPLVEYFGDVGVITHDNHYRGDRLWIRARVADLVVPLLPLLGEYGQRSLRFLKYGVRLGTAVAEPVLVLELVVDVAPETVVLGIGPADLVLLRRIVADRQPGDLHDAALDGVDQAEIADQPRERSPFGVTARREVERRR